MLSPVAETWDEALVRLFALNKERGIGPTSVRQLAIALNPANAEDRRSVINRVRRNNSASEATAELVAAALQVSRSELPPAARPPSKAELADRLEEAEDALNALAGDVRRGLAKLGSRVDALEQQAPSKTARDAK